jgi:hypothetical protein
MYESSSGVFIRPSAFPCSDARSVVWLASLPVLRFNPSFRS